MCFQLDVTFPDFGSHQRVPTRTRVSDPPRDASAKNVLKFHTWYDDTDTLVSLHLQFLGIRIVPLHRTQKSCAISKRLEMMLLHCICLNARGKDNVSQAAWVMKSTRKKAFEEVVPCNRYSCRFAAFTL